MKRKTKKLLYESPVSRDLSNLAVKGQEQPHGECTGGSYPYYNCVDGPSYRATCNAGSNVDTAKQSCAPGVYVTAPTCKEGAFAATICYSGANQQLT
jgi:hypothetical protein